MCLFFRSNPVLWTPRDVQEFIASQRETEIASLASTMKQEQVLYYI